MNIFNNWILKIYFYFYIKYKYLYIDILFLFLDKKFDNKKINEHVVDFDLDIDFFSWSLEKSLKE